MTNSDKIIIPQLTVIFALILSFIAIMVYKYRKQVKEITGTFAALIIVFWEDIRERFHL